MQKIRKPGFYADGGNLYLHVDAHGNRSWIFRYQRNGKATDLGLGPTHAVAIERARQKASEGRALLADGVDPLQSKRDREKVVAVSVAKGMTFDACASAYIDAHKPGWRNPKHADQWTAKLNTYASPVFGSLPVAAVDTGLVMKVLEPIWYTKTETATRLRGRRTCSDGRRCAAIAPATILRAGAGTSTSCYRCARRCRN